MFSFLAAPRTPAYDEGSLIRPHLPPLFPLNSGWVRTADVDPISLDAPLVTAADATGGEDKGDRRTLLEKLDVLEKGKTTESGSAEDGAAAIMTEVVTAPLKSNFSKSAADPDVARTSESVLAEAATIKPDAGQVESSGRAGGIGKRSQVEVLLGGEVTRFLQQRYYRSRDGYGARKPHPDRRFAFQ